MSTTNFGGYRLLKAYCKSVSTTFEFPVAIARATGGAIIGGQFRQAKTLRCDRGDAL